MTIHVNIIEGSQLVETKDGLAATRVFIVSGLTGDAPAIQREALDYSGVPQRGDTHPSIAEIQVDERRAVPQGIGIVRVTVVYREDVEDQASGVYSIEIGSQIVTESTTNDADGRPIQTEYSMFNPGETGEQEYTTAYYNHEVEVQRVQVTYIVRALLDYNPIGMAHDLAGTIGDWGGGDLPDSWLCTGINAKSDDNGKTWDTSFEFVQATSADGWDAVVQEVNPLTGQPAASLRNDEESIRTRNVRVYQPGNWHKMPIPKPYF